VDVVWWTGLYEDGIVTFDLGGGAIPKNAGGACGGGAPPGGLCGAPGPAEGGGPAAPGGRGMFIPGAGIQFPPCSAICLSFRTLSFEAKSAILPSSSMRWSNDPYTASGLPIDARGGQSAQRW
jgi:hypothetical protein